MRQGRKLLIVLRLPGMKPNARQVEPIEGQQAEESATDELAGLIVDQRYCLLKVIGSGAWSVVYRARCLTLNRFVAIKILRSHLLPDEAKVERFRREASNFSRLSHPNIVTIHDYGVMPNKLPYIVMEYLVGRSFDQVIRAQGKLPVRRVLEVLIQSCAALNSAHTAGLIHSDIKPSNIFLCDVDNGWLVKLLDFGLSKETGSNLHTSLTATGETTGTFAYMSPEQCAGEPADERSDLYTLGCVMYEALTGQRPFEGKSAYELMHKHVNQKPVLPAGLLPPNIEEIVDKALSKERADRYQSAAEMKNALLSALEQLSSETDSIDTKKRSQRPKTLFYAAAGLILVGAIATFGYLAYLRLPGSETVNRPAGSLINLPPAIRQEISSTGTPDVLTYDIIDKAGTKVADVAKSPREPGKPFHEQVARYGPGGAQIGWTQKTYGADGKLTRTWAGDDRDHDGMIEKASEKIYRKNGTVSQETVTSFDKNGKKTVATRIYWPNGKLKLIEIDSYNVDAQVEKMELKQFAEDGKLTIHEIWTYDATGRVTSYQKNVG